jgi:hypothetical protein
MKYELLAVSTDELEMPLGLIDGPQDLMRIYSISQATAYRILRIIKETGLSHWNPKLGIMIEVVPID